MVCRHLEDTLSRNESLSARTQEKFGDQIDKVQEEMESVRACAVSAAPELIRLPGMMTAPHLTKIAAYAAPSSIPIWLPIAAPDVRPQAPYVVQSVNHRKSQNTKANTQVQEQIPQDVTAQPALNCSACNHVTLHALNTLQAYPVTLQGPTQVHAPCNPTGGCQHPE